MATVEMVRERGRWVFEVDAGRGIWIGPVTVADDRGGEWDCICVTDSAHRFGSEYGGDRVRLGCVTAISGFYRAGTFSGCYAEADWCRILAEEEGLTAMTVNGSTVWSEAADAEAEALAAGADGL